MNVVISLLFLFVVTLMIIGLISPKKLAKLAKKETDIWSRKKITVSFGIIAFILMILGGMTSPKTAVQKANTNKVESQAKTQADASIRPNPSASTKDQNKSTVKVTKVVDGDTIQVLINSKTETIRLIGINTPETVDPRKSVECFGEKASAVAKENLLGQTVNLESDPSQGERDKYNRLLRYVWTDDGVVDFGKMMISTGFAYEYTYNTPYKYQTEYKQAQKEAEVDKKGLWADNACDTNSLQPTYQAPTTNTQPKTTNTSGSCKYSCNGPDRDCSDFSTHAEAQAFFNCCGFTANNDPMKLDSARGVGNGIACESLP